MPKIKIKEKTEPKIAKKPKPAVSQSKSTEKKNRFSIEVEDMMKAGVHLGHEVSKLHPKMNDFVLGVRGMVHMIDLEKTAVYLEKALEFIEKLSKEKKTLLFVGTKVPIRKAVKETAISLNMPYVVDRWLGGTFTNFEIISKGIKAYQRLKESEQKGELEKYTKKERVKISKEIEKLRIKFEGLQKLAELPAAIFICDLRKNDLALKEAKQKGVKIIALVDTNCDPTLIDYPIPANDDSITSVKYILGKVKDAFLESK